MRTIQYKMQTAVLILFTVLSASCQKSVAVSEDDKREELKLDDWTAATHSDQADPNYDVVFNHDKVNRIDIVLSADEFASMRNNLSELLSSGGPGADFSENPVYVAADFYFNGIQWYEVGVRYKGNSSLKSAGRSGIKKLPLRFKFDKFEDDYPEIKNQRFYGFKELSMSSAYKDPSFMRERMAPELFRAFGVPAPQTAFYEIWLDEGDGEPKYYGLYTMVEVVFDTMLQKMFGNSEGNCYKPDGEGARLGATGFSLNDFEKKTNEELADWNDVQALYEVLHSTTRQSAVDQWKMDLEALFDVDGFLKYLAANNTIQNWDTYGKMTHNYYLYHDPSDDLIKWIPWDNNEAFGDNGRGAISLSMNEVRDDWPLITYVMGVPAYREKYNAYLKAFSAGPFFADKMIAEYDSMASMIEESATNELRSYSNLPNTAAFYEAVSDIKAHSTARNQAVEDYLN